MREEHENDKLALRAAKLGSFKFMYRTLAASNGYWHSLGVCVEISRLKKHNGKVDQLVTYNVR